MRLVRTASCFVLSGLALAACSKGPTAASASAGGGATAPASAAEEGQQITTDAEWTPSAASIVALDPKLVMPKGAHPMASYMRNYAGTMSLGKRAIEAYPTPPSQGEHPAWKIVRAGESSAMQSRG